MTATHLRLPGLARGLIRQPVPMSLDELRHAAPSVFAEEKHASRSDRYAYIPTHAVVQGLIEEGFQPVAVQQGRSRIEGKENFTKHMIRFRHDTTEMRRVGHTIPEIVLINSHDGTSSYKVLAGLLELVCLNGLIVAHDLIEEVKIGHTRRAVEGVIDGTWKVVKEVHRSLEKRDEWSETRLTRDEQEAFAIAAHMVRFPDLETPIARAVEPTRLLTAHRTEDASNSLWHTYNRIQENSLRARLEGEYQRQVTREDGSTHQQTRRTATRPINSIDDNVRLNQALWALTQRMSELKQ